MKNFNPVEEFVHRIANKDFGDVLSRGTTPPKRCIREEREKALDKAIGTDETFHFFNDNISRLAPVVLYSETTLERAAFVGNQVDAKQCAKQSFLLVPKANIESIATTLCIHFGLEGTNDEVKLAKQLRTSREDAKGAYRRLKNRGFSSWGYLTGDVERQLVVLPNDEVGKATAYYTTGLQKTNGSLYLLEAKPEFLDGTPLHLVFSPVPKSNLYFMYLFNPDLVDNTFHVAGVYNFIPTVATRLKQAWKSMPLRGTFSRKDEKDQLQIISI